MSARSLGARERVHGYLADPADRVSYDRDLPAGRPVALRVTPTHPQARTRQGTSAADSL